MRTASALIALAFSSALLAQAPYQEQRADCLKLADADARKTCLREAGAARVEARRGGLTQSADYEKNLTARCSYLPGADREDCLRRMRGEGTTSGSVSGGGIYRELRTIVPADEAGSGATR